MHEIELTKPAREQAIASIQRYFEANLDGPIGHLPASQLLGFLLEEIAPAVYNQAIADAQTRIQQRAADLSGELFAEEFQYWPRLNAKKKPRR